MTINELSDIVNNWFEEDENNRSVFMVMTDRNDIALTEAEIFLRFF